MGRQLNIRSDEAYELAHGAAKRTGKGVSTVVVEALREYRQKMSAPGEMTPEQKANAEAIREAGRRAAAQAKPGVTYQAVVDDMYDEKGLPR